MSRDDLMGQRFGMLTAITFIAPTIPGRSGRSFWEFQCDCGGKCIRPAHLIKRAVKLGRPCSCGCALKQSQKAFAARNADRNVRKLTARDRQIEAWLECSAFKIDEIYRAAHRMLARKVVDC